MNIRSLTTGAALPLDEDDRALLVERLGGFAAATRAALENAGFTVQSTRLSAQPLDRWLAPGPQAPDVLAALGRTVEEAGIDYWSLGTIQACDEDAEAAPPLAEMLSDLLMSTPNAFGSVQVGVRRNGAGLVSMVAVRSSARVIRALSTATPDGFSNLRFAVAANCPPHVPFFPASYYVEDAVNSGRPEFGVAVEAAGLAVLAFEQARTLEEARQNLLALLVEHGTKAAEVCTARGAEAGLTFTGLDISMAPYPSPDRSIGHALEIVSGAPVGAPGTVAASAFVTGVMREARDKLRTVGYSGLMLPVLEDQTLADRAAEGLVSLDTLLLMSAVCGLGLDALPLPGDVTVEQIERIVLDMAALAVRLDKPLTARLLPVPGKAAGEPAEWPDFPYFARGRVMAVPDAGSGGLLLGETTLTL
jgi:uncharacterized protein (UPF0210 family)